MKFFFRYFKARLKRTARAIPGVIAFALVVCICVLSLLSSIFAERDSSQPQETVKVGICGSLEDTYLEIGIFALKNMDASNIYVDFLTLDEKTAADMLENGEIFGYVIVPENFVQSVMQGANYQLRYVAGNHPQSMGPQLMNEVVKMVSDFVTNTQNVVYGYMNIARDHGIPREQYRPDADILNFNCIDSIIARSNALNVYEVGIGEGLDFKNYYTCDFLILLVLLCGCACAPFLIKKDMSLERLMFSRSCKSFSQIFAEYIPFALILILCCLGLLLGTAFFSGGLNTGIGFIDNMTFGAIPSMLCELLPAIILLSLMQFFVYELCTGIISGMLLQLFVCIALSFASGFFYPIYTLPSVVQKIADYLPTHIAFEYTSKVITESEQTNMGAVLICIAVLFVLCTALRKRKIRSNI